MNKSAGLQYQFEVAVKLSSVSSHLRLRQVLTLARLAIVLIMMIETEKGQIACSGIRRVLIKVRDLSVLWTHVAVKAVANATAASGFYENRGHRINRNTLSCHRVPMICDIRT
jgi:hypothetical protein